MDWFFSREGKLLIGLFHLFSLFSYSGFDQVIVLFPFFLSLLLSFCLMHFHILIITVKFVRIVHFCSLVFLPHVYS